MSIKERTGGKLPHTDKNILKELEEFIALHYINEEDLKDSYMASEMLSPFEPIFEDRGISEEKYPYSSEKKEAPRISEEAGIERAPLSATLAGSAAAELEELINNSGKTFQETLLFFQNRRGLSNPDLYNRSGVDRRLFSKIFSEENYHPRKRTVLQLALGLNLNPDDAATLLKSAGYSFSESDLTDIIVLFCLNKGYYDLMTVDYYLYEYDQPTLGSIR